MNIAYLYCLLPILYHFGPFNDLQQACSSLPCSSRLFPITLAGNEMLWFSRGALSESELPLGYNAHSGDARTQLIGYEINLLNKV